MTLVEDLFNNRKVQIWIIGVLIIGLLPFALNEMQFGMDFTGGTIISIKLEETASQMEIEETISILSQRLNSFGVKDVAVRQVGDQLITVEIAETNPKVVNQLQAIIAEQGRFEAMFEGKTILSGDEIVEVITSPQQGFGWRKRPNGFEWSVPFLVSNEGAGEFAEAIKGKCTPRETEKTCEEQLIMFIDRPKDAVILMTRSHYENEKDVPIDFETSTSLISLEELAKQGDINYIITDTITQEILTQIEGKTVIIKSGAFKTEQLTTAKKIKEIEKQGDYWIDDAANIENIVYLTSGVTTGKPINQPSITGFAIKEDDAAREVKRIEVLLRSGKLPISVSIDTSSTFSPELGEDFLGNSLLAGLIAIFTVIGIIFIRYRKWKITFPILVTAMSEVLMILGMAIWIGWQIDLAAVAGIIAAVGTGVDHQIIITDEILRDEAEKFAASFVEKLKKAFGIIMMAATTTICAMLPLWFIGIGQLRGFALTTILGSLIGVLISRPAFGQIIKKLLEKKD